MNNESHSDSCGESENSVFRQRVQRKTLWVLVVATSLGGLGVGASLSVGALLFAEVSGNDALSGLGSATFMAGSAAAGIPLARISARHGRRPAIVTGSLVAMVGSLLAVLGAVMGQALILAVGLACIGFSSAVQLLSRFAAADLSLPQHRARDLSLVVWSITLGAVIGPNLMGPGAVIGDAVGITPLAGIFIFPFIAQAIAALVAWLGLRPDPLIVAQQLRHKAGDTETSPHRVAIPEPGRRALRRPQIAVIIMTAVAHAVMVALMAMTPLHLTHHGGTPELVGITLSLHIAGMYAFSPVFGILATRLGSRRVIWLGWGTFLLATVIAYFAGSSHAAVQVAMIFVGLGWSAVTVAAAALLTEVSPPDQRPLWQGRSDTSMNASGAVAGTLAGVAFAFGAFSLLAVLSAVVVLVGIGASVQLSRYR